MNKNTVLFDVDGTLSDPTHRLAYIQGENKDYANFFDKVGADTPIHPTIELLRGAKMLGYQIVIVTGRPDYLRETTEAWLHQYSIPFDSLHLVRPEGDYAPAADLKRKWVRAFGAFRVLYAFEDDVKCVDMYREEGVTCFQVQRRDVG